MVAELVRETPIKVLHDLSIIEIPSAEVSNFASYEEGGHAKLISEAQVHGSVTLTDTDLITRGELIHPIMRDVLAKEDVRITHYGLAKAINRETGEARMIEVFPGKQA